MPDVNTPGSRVTPVNSGLITRAIKPITNFIANISSTWFGPQQPLKPFAPPDVAGRQWNYPYGVNLQYIPRSTENYSFEELRGLADSCDILRSVIETRKDQIEALDWQVRVKNITGDKAKTKTTPDQQKRIDQVTEFLRSPDQRHTFAEWLRMILEDMFVIDAVALYRRRDRVGRLWALEPIDGATIKPLITDDGRTPLPPDPSYQQVLHGVPAVDYGMDELIYKIRNPRTNRLYGLSHVEQCIITINTVIRRALWQLDYYAEGSQPDALIGLPKDWTTDQVLTFQAKWNAEISGNLEERRKVKFMPGDFKYQPTKEPTIKDEQDEWFARIICFVFSISPQAFTKQMNRATAETQQEATLQEGLAPLQRYVCSLLNPIISEEFDSDDLEFCFTDDTEQDPQQAMEINTGYTKAGILTIDEVRERIGVDPMGGTAATLLVLTGTGLMPVDGADEQQYDTSDPADKPPPVMPGASNPIAGAKPGANKPAPGNKQPSAKKLRKAGGRKPMPFLDSENEEGGKRPFSPRILYP